MIKPLISASLRLCARIFSRSSVEIIRPRPMSDDELIGALSVDADHPVLLAMLELIDRARTEARSEAKSAIKSDREMLFSLGGEHGLDRLQDYLLSLRAEANRRKNSS